MKECKRCRKGKPDSEFWKSRKNPGGLYSYCKPCARKSRLGYIHADRENHNRKQRDAYARKRQLIWDYLSDHPCVDCGEIDPVVLDFDHVRGEKKFNISDGMRCSIERISQEIEKCEVRCANCHRRITYARRCSSVAEQRLGMA